MAKRMDIASLGNLHEMLSGASLSVTGSAPRGYISIEHEILYHIRGCPIAAKETMDEERETTLHVI